MNVKRVKLLVLALLAGCFSLKAQSVWTVQNSGTTSDLNNVDFYSAIYGIAVGNGGTILRTVDGGLNWSAISSPESVDLFGVSYLDSLEVFISGASGTILKSEDGGLSWTIHSVSGVTSDLLSISFEPGGSGIACGRNQAILRTGDRGNTWSVLRNMWIGTFNSAQAYSGETGFIFGENSIMNHLIGKITEPGDSLSFTYFYINSGGILTEGKIMDGYYFNEDSCVTVDAIFPGDAAITCNQSWGNDEWAMVYYRPSSVLNGVDFEGNYGVAVGGAIDGSGSIILESQDKGMSWNESPEMSKKGSMNKQVKIKGNAVYVVGQAGKILKKVLVTGITDVLIPDDKIRVYPNPLSGNHLLIYLSGNETKAMVTIRDMSGKSVYNRELNCDSGSHKMRADVTGLKSGCYVIEVVSDNTHYHAKILIN